VNNRTEILKLDQATLVDNYISSQNLIQEQQLQIEQLTSKYDQLVRMIYGRKSERFIPTNPSQLTLFDDPLAEQKADQPTIDVKASKRRKAKASNHKGRQLLQKAPHLERRQTIIEPDVDTSNMKCIGEQVTEKLVYIKAELYVERIVRRKYIDKQNNKDSDNKNSNTKTTPLIYIADKPVEIFPQLIADVSLIEYLLISKYVDHLPLYRLIEIFKRHQLKIPPATMNGWIHQGIKLLKPLYEALIKDVLEAQYIQADETTIRVLEKHTKKKKSHLGYYWAYHSPVNKAIFFEYQKGRDQSGPLNLFANFQGVVQCDGYEVYEAIAKKNKNISLIHCMAHARRKFEKALSNNKEKATYVLEEMKILYRVERLIREYNLSDDRINKLRNKFSKPVLEHLGEWLKEQAKIEVPSLSLGKAIFYSLKRWKKLSAYTEDPKLQIDNNLIENKIRPIAVGRKNYLFAGSHSAAQNAAMIYSLFGTCKLNNINPSHWLKDVFNRIQDQPINQIHKLLPYNW